MSGYTSSVYMYYLLWIINFCETTYNNVVNTFSQIINIRLEGRVLYYAMYSKSDKELYYTKLYDVTSLIDRIRIIFLSMIYQNYFEKNSIFTYNEVHSNLENLTSFMIHAVVVSYIKNGVMTTEIMSFKDIQHSSSSNIQHNEAKFVYAIVINEHGIEYDFTREFNNHMKDIKDSPLNIEDFVHIMKSIYQKNLVDDKDIKLKVMLDNEFHEVVYNSKDKLIV